MQEYALEEIKGCIKFIGEQTGEKFDWDAYFAAMKVYNRTISRRDMREQVNKYMTSVLQEEPVDPTLVDFDDTQAW